METTNKKLADRITKVKMKFDESCAFAEDSGRTYAICQFADKEANAELIAEAFNVTNETGLSPRELKEQRDEMNRVLKCC